MTRSLLLKGLAGIAALGGAVGGGFVAINGGLFGGKKAPEEPRSEDVSNFTQKELIDKVGLNCRLGEEDTEIKDSETKECSVKTEGTIKVKIGDKEEEGVTFTTNGSKLKVSKSDELGTDGREKYTKKLKFVVDSGDLTLTKKEGAGTATTIQKLEQFETYEIFLKDKKFYLRRKTDAKEEKIKALGLPSACTLPDTASSECSLTTEEIKKVNFENQTGGVTVSTGTVTLKISKMSDSTDFTDGYRFTFTFPSEVTIGSKNIKTNIPYDFKIKKPAGTGSLSLEKAWTADSLGKKVGLQNCNTECTIQESSGQLRVKQMSEHDNEIKQKSLKKKANGSGKGKIKVTEDVEGYNQGFKFEISEGFIELDGTTGSDEREKITRLGEYETYEIKEEGNEG